MNNTLTKADIVEAIYAATKKNRREVKRIVDQLIDIMTDALKRENSVLLSGFGKFECYAKASRRGRNPSTSETIILPPRNVVVFRLSRVFRKEMNP